MERKIELFDYNLKRQIHKTITTTCMKLCENINLVFRVDTHSRKLKLISYQQFVCSNKDNINLTRRKLTV